MRQRLVHVHELFELFRVENEILVAAKIPSEGAVRQLRRVLLIVLPDDSLSALFVDFRTGTNLLIVLLLQKSFQTIDANVRLIFSSRKIDVDRDSRAAFLHRLGDDPQLLSTGQIQAEAEKLLEGELVATDFRILRRKNSPRICVWKKKKTHAFAG